jgi:hypothetical protein
MFAMTMAAATDGLKEDTAQACSAQRFHASFCRGDVFCWRCLDTPGDGT